MDNLFIMGASLFPHNATYNPTGPVAAIAYMAADIIKNVYVKNLGKLIHACVTSILSLATVAAAMAGTSAPAEDLGKKGFETCVACHSVKAGENGVGPHLNKLVGRIAGTSGGFRYSGPMKRSAIVWDEKNLSAFFRKPQEVVPGNRMPFSGVVDEAALMPLVQYLGTATKQSCDRTIFAAVPLLSRAATRCASGPPSVGCGIWR